MILPVVDYTILYNQKDISLDISNYIISIQYADKVTGESDTLEISVDDHDQRWQNDWYPAKGDNLQLIIRKDGQQLNCGVFEADELASSSSISGDVFVIKGLAAGIRKKLRTKNSYAHEDKSLREIANTVGASMGLTLQGTVPDIRLHRCNQYRETNLGFLNRIGSEYGCIFSVRGDNLIFTYYRDIETRNASLILNKQDLISWDLRDQTHKTFKKAKLKHHDPYAKQTVSYLSKDNDEDSDEDSADDLEIRVKAENAQQASAKGKHALFKNNTQGVGGDIVLPGHLLFVSGNNFQLNGAGNFSGIYHIIEATHSISRSGAHQVAGNIKRVKTIDPSFYKTI
jgi:phage protein D